VLGIFFSLIELVVCESLGDGEELKNINVRNNGRG
jgi:hypothetical protein